MKIPNVGYHLARAEGHAIRAAYSAALPNIVARRVKVRRELPLDVCSYSGAAMLPEQVVSIRSLLRNAGRPRRFTVFSDGTHSARARDLLCRIDSCVQVGDVAQPQAADLTPQMRAYFETHPTGLQLAMMMTLAIAEPTLYADSDVLFFPGAENIERLLQDRDAPARYLADCHVSADERLFRDASEQANPVNTGLLFFRRRLDWSVALERLRDLNGAPTFFTNQTLTQFVMHANGAEPLDDRAFVLQLDDQFIHRDLHAQSRIVARHYVNPVRHKFWTALLR